MVQLRFHGAPRFVHSSPCQVCSFLLSVGFEVQFPVMWMRLAAICQAALHIRCVKSNHVSGILREHIAIHSHFNKSLDHTSVYSSQFVFSIMQSTLTRLCLPFNQKMHLKPLQSFLCNYHALRRSINSKNNKTSQYSSTHWYSVVDVFIFIEYFLQTSHHSYVYLRCNMSTY